MSDQRETSLYPSWGVTCDFARERMIISDVEFPAHFVVCPVCEGRGKYVNPSIDSHGLSAEDFDEDPDFREDYMRGRYDVRCETCGGNNVILEPSTPEGKAALAEVMASEAESRACYAAERRMGA